MNLTSNAVDLFKHYKNINELLCLLSHLKAPEKILDELGHVTDYVYEVCKTSTVQINFPEYK
jgi:hypothetical protein